MNFFITSGSVYIMKFGPVLLEKKSFESKDS